MSRQIDNVSPVVAPGAKLDPGAHKRCEPGHSQLPVQHRSSSGHNSSLCQSVERNYFCKLHCYLKVYEMSVDFYNAYSSGSFFILPNFLNRFPFKISSQEPGRMIIYPGSQTGLPNSFIHSCMYSQIVTLAALERLNKNPYRLIIG